MSNPNDQLVEQISAKIKKDLTPLFEAMNARFDTVDESIADLRIRVVGLETKVEDFDETIQGFGKAVDSDSVQLIDHEKRIRRLEKTQKVA